MSAVETIIILLCVILLLIITWLVLDYFKESSVELKYSIVIYISLFFGFVGVIVFPIDISWSVPGENAIAGLKILWNSIYWATLLLAWVYLPIMMGYWASGQFSRKSRLKESIWVQSRMFLIIGFFCLLIVLYAILAKNLTREKIQGIIIAITNTYGLCYVVVLLGYGIVMFPIFIIKRINPSTEVDVLYLRGRELDNEIFSFQMDLVSTKCNMKSILSLLEKTKKDQKYVIIIQEIIASLPDDEQINMKRHQKGYIDKEHWIVFTEDEMKKMDDKHLMSMLSTLNSKSKQSCLLYERKLNQYDELVESIIEMKHLTGSSDIPLEVSHSIMDRLLYLFQRFWFACRKPILICCGISILLSGITLFTEITTILFQITGHSLSPFSMAYDNSKSSLIRLLLAAGSISYVSICFFYSYFNLRIPFISTYYLYPHHTDTYSLAHNATMLCRFQFSLFYHFFTLCQLPNARFNEIALSSVMSNMSTIPFLGSSFNNYMSLLVVIMSVFTLYTAIKSYQYKKLNRNGLGRDIESGERSNSDRVLKMKEGKDLIDLTLKKRGIMSDGKQTTPSHMARYYYKGIQLQHA